MPHFCQKLRPQFLEYDCTDFNNFCSVRFSMFECTKKIRDTSRLRLTCAQNKRCNAKIGKIRTNFGVQSAQFQMEPPDQVHIRFGKFFQIRIHNGRKYLEQVQYLKKKSFGMVEIHSKSKTCAKNAQFLPKVAGAVSRV